VVVVLMLGWRCVVVVAGRDQCRGTRKETLRTYFWLDAWRRLLCDMARVGCKDCGEISKSEIIQVLISSSEIYPRAKDI
jgi:hypothetical protein